MRLGTSNAGSYVSFLVIPCTLWAGAASCTTTNGTTASGGTVDPYSSRVLVCNWKDPDGPHPDDNWTYQKRFCVRSGVCTDTTPVLCSYNNDGNINEWQKYTPNMVDGGGAAYWDGYCDDSCPTYCEIQCPPGSEVPVEPGKLPTQSCAADSEYDPAVYGACEPPSSSDPTTGGNSTGGDAGTDTDGPNVEVWVCSELAHENCQDRSGSGQTADDMHCWSTAVNSARCVNAATQADAIAACNCLCSVTDTSYSSMCDDPGICEVDYHMDCSAPYSGDPTDEPTPLGLSSHLCEMPILDATVAAGMCPNGFKPFDAMATLVLADGTSASVAGIAGYLKYTVSNCTGSTCDLDVEVLEIPAEDLTGVYFQPASVGGSYAIEDVGVRMTGSLAGTWIPSRQTVTFSGDPFWARVTMTAASVDSVSLPAEPYTIGTNQIVGNLSPATSVLTLNFSFNVPGGTVSFSLTTH